MGGGRDGGRGKVLGAAGGKSFRVDNDYRWRDLWRRVCTQINVSAAARVGGDESPLLPIPILSPPSHHLLHHSIPSSSPYDLHPTAPIPPLSTHLPYYTLHHLHPFIPKPSPQFHHPHPLTSSHPITSTPIPPLSSHRPHHLHPIIPSTIPSRPPHDPHPTYPHPITTNTFSTTLIPPPPNHHPHPAIPRLTPIPSLHDPHSVTPIPIPSLSSPSHHSHPISPISSSTIPCISPPSPSLLT